MAWPGRLAGGTQGDKVHVKALSRGGLAAGHGNRAGNSPLGQRDSEGAEWAVMGRSPAGRCSSDLRCPYVGPAAR
jgi:hypothetical protein